LADFHAADLWVAIVPDASKVGPAMEAAGKEAKGKFREGVKDFGKAIHEDLDRVAAKSKDVFSGMGKELKGTFSKESFRADIELTSRQISEGFKKAGQVAGQAFNSELGQQIKQVAAEELGALVGEKIGTAIGNSPIGQSLRSAVESAAPALDHIRDTMAAIRERDASAALKGMSEALRGMGQTQAADTLDKVSTKTGELQTKMGALKGNIEGTTSGLLGLTNNSGKIAGGLSQIAGAAGPLAATFAALDTLMPGFDQHLQGVLAQLQGKKGFNVEDWFRTAVPGLNLLPDLNSWKPSGAIGDLPVNVPRDVLPPINVKPPASAPAPPIQLDPKRLVPGKLDLGGNLDLSGAFQEGGPIRGPGAIGRDSVFMLGAPGEHVVTAGEVDAAGGHQNVRAIRNLMAAGFFKNIRGYQGGGEVTDWDAVAQGESHGDWHINTGNGYFGGLQFDLPTWREFGGTEFAPRPDQATREQQIAVANRVPVGQRAGRWPNTYSLGAGRGGAGGAGGGGGHGGGGPKGSKQGLQPAASNLWDVIAANFPQIGEIGGVRADPLPYHPSGRALDIMIPGAGGLNDPTPPAAKAIGDKIYQFLMANAAALGVDTSGTLWQQKDHYNHIHAQLLDHFKGFTDASQFGGGGGRGGQMPVGSKEDPLYTSPGQGGGAGGGGMEGQGQQLAKGFASGILEIFGLDGSVFKGFGGGKSPLDFGAFKLFTGLMHGISSPGGGGGGGGAGGSGLPGLDTLLNPGAAISAALAPAAGGPAAVTGGDTHNYYGDVGKFEVNQTGVGDTGVNDWQRAANSSGRARAMDAWAPAP
jgi:hypothetical protein